MRKTGGGYWWYAGGMARGLTSKQERFVAEYLVDRNATQAAIRAGYSGKTAEQIGYQLLQKASVAEALAPKIARQLDRIELKADDVIEEIRRLAMLDPAEIYTANHTLKPIPEWPAVLRACIAGIEVEEMWEGYGEDRKLVGQVSKVKFWSKVEALKLAAQYLKLVGTPSNTFNLNLLVASGDRQARIDMLLTKRIAANAA